MLTAEEIKTIVKNNEDEIHKIRQAIENFRIAIQADILKGCTIIGNLYSKFIEMKPCIHRYCNDMETIDLSAFVYALQRLPEEITKKYRIYIRKEPDELNNIPGITKLETKARRRASYNLGKELLFIAREGETDIFDILTCLIMYGIEARKIKDKISMREDITKDIQNLTTKNEISSEGKNQIIARLSNILGVKFEDLIKADESLDFRLFFILNNILSIEPEQMAIEFDKSFPKTDDSVKAKKWVEKIVNELKKYGDRPIAIISSDTHGVANCLTGFASENREKITELAKKDLELSRIEAGNLSTLYYLLHRLYKKQEYNWLLQEKIAYEDKLGITLIKDEYDTGVDVQVIDLSKILERLPEKIDPRIKFDKEKAKEKGIIILNMDYSFGKQGTHNMRRLCETLGKRIDSISITGKAGITFIGGERFDIMLPTHVVPQIIGGIYDFPTGNSLKAEDFNGLLETGRIHSGGPILTVPGTAMQNDLVFCYYIYFDNILGVEMEAAPYVEAIEKAYKRNQLKKDILLNVGYWASDKPLNSKETLAENHMDLGCIPAYALILATLNKILNKP